MNLILFGFKGSGKSRLPKTTEQRILFSQKGQKLEDRYNAILGKQEIEQLELLIALHQELSN